MLDLWDHISASLEGGFIIPSIKRQKLSFLGLRNLRPPTSRLPLESLGSTGPQPRPPSPPDLSRILLSPLEQPQVRQVLRGCLLGVSVTYLLEWKQQALGLTLVHGPDLLLLCDLT